MEHVEKHTKIGAIMMTAFAVLFLAGCDHPEDREEKDYDAKGEMKTEMKEKKEDKKEEKKEGKKEKGDADAEFDAKVAAAVEKYIADNQSAFGKQVIESANAYQAAEQQAQEAAKAEKVKDVPGIREGDHVLGNADADLVLFEYSDYHCPYCKRFHPTTEQLAKDDNIAVVLRPMPLVHSQTATPLHEAAECVADIAGNDAFWDFSVVLFDKAKAVNMENYTAELKTLNIGNIEEIQKCVAEGKFKDKVAKSVEEGYALGINGTPTSILKNVETGEVRLVGGAYPYEAIKGFADELRK